MYRTKQAETFLSVAIIAILVTIALILYKVQSRPNAAVTNLAPPVHEDGGMPLPRSVDQPIISIPAGMRAMTAPELFDSVTLSNKINGKAELYLSAGFIELTAQRFQRIDEETAWLELYLYNMGAASNAFAVFSGQRRQDGGKLAFTRHAYGTDNAVFFSTGPYYVEIIAAISGPAATTMLTDVAQQVLARWGGARDRSEETTGPERLFPQKGLMSDSITLIAKDAFGFYRLDHVYTARYQTLETQTILFVSPRASAKEAEALALAYRDFLVEFGGTETKLPPESNREGLFMIDILDSYEMIFSKGPYLAGVHMGEEKVSTIEEADRLYHHIKQLSAARPDKE